MRKLYSSTATTLQYPAIAVSFPLGGRGESRSAVTSAVAKKMKASAVRVSNHLLGVNVSSLIFLFTVLITTLVILNLVLANNLSTKGEEVRVLESRKAILAKRNEELNNEIAYLSSLSRIKKDAAEQLGMVETAGTALDYLRPPKFASR